MFRRFMSLSSALMVSSLALAASAALTRIDTPNIQFQAKGPLGMTIEGGFSDLTVSEADGKVTAVAKLGGIKTGIDKRDEHLQKHLTSKTSTFVFDRSALKFPDNEKTSNGTVGGTLTLNGKTHAQNFEYQVKRTGSDYHVQAKATIHLPTYSLKLCMIGDDTGPCVEDDVKVKIKLKLRDQ